ncbi:3408_t:CDS:2, partial [Cetraspora pellucida]
MVIIDQVTNIESSIFYVFTAKAITSDAVNAEFSTSYMINIQPNSSYMIDTKTNTLCKNAVYDKATTEEVNNIDLLDVSLKKNMYLRRVLTLMLTATDNQNRQLLRAKYSDATFLDMDLTNAIQYYKVKSKDLKNDALQLLLYLIEKHLEESDWSIEFELDSDNCLTQIFWMTPKQISLWLEYYNVILNNNTSKTNRYQMPLSLFFAVNNNIRSRFVVQALVFDKTVDSYLWILQCTMKAKGVEPMVFVTDADLAMDTGIQTTLCIKEYNNIIKRVLHNNSSLCDLIASVSSEILSAVDYILLKYLTLQILSIECIEMAQCLYFDATLVDLTVIELDNENKNINDQFTEDVYDTKQILLNNQNAAARHFKFGESWSLAWQAIQLAVKCDDNDIKLWLKHFINQKKHLLIQNRESKDSDDSNYSEKENNSAIKNLVITKNKG